MTRHDAVDEYVCVPLGPVAYEDKPSSEVCGASCYESGAVVGSVRRTAESWRNDGSYVSSRSVQRAALPVRTEILPAGRRVVAAYRAIK